MSELSYADQRHRAWLQKQQTQAAEHFEIQVTGNPLYGWSDRTICGAADLADGTRGWLRITSEQCGWAHGDAWTGNADANQISDVSKPTLLDFWEYWDEGRRVRAELSTRVEGTPCSPTHELRTGLHLPTAWWTALGTNIDNLTATSTERTRVRQEDIDRRILVFWGDNIDTTVRHWTTAHGDLHWANLMRPELTILDWEFWGQAPTGYDAATLYCYSLLHPETAELVWSTFEDILTSTDGRIAQLYVAAWLLLRIERGDSQDLAAPLHQHARALI